MQLKDVGPSTAFSFRPSTFLAAASVSGGLVVQRPPNGVNKSIPCRGIRRHSLEQEDVRLWLVHLIVLPTETLRLGDGSVHPVSQRTTGP